MVLFTFSVITVGVSLFAGIGVVIPFLRVFKEVFEGTKYSILPLVTLFYSLSFMTSVFHSISYF